MEIDPLHRRLIEAVLPVCAEYGLALAGGHALNAHGLVDRPCEDVNFVTATPLSLDVVAWAVAGSCHERGLQVRTAGQGGETYVRLLVGDPRAGRTCEADLASVPLRMRPTRVGRCPVVAFEDAIGLKMGALAGRSAARDLIDVAAVAGDYGFERLESLGRGNAPDFSLERLADRLTFYELMDEAEFQRYGLDEDGIRRVRRLAAEWAHDINMRLYEDDAFETYGTDPDL